ncbi:DUF6580 family putative transport protein [Thalassoroseus pseudoceratinae]|uniref:DUF6580 family putative transport protein n=1 Tax=Thalassoroseus pseudoceratinae TaxID=2713176 RepID=UPI0014207DB0|nr:DUF6580 family putative transport protein [Thalassoroseus pseudoceratinae]
MNSHSTNSATGDHATNENDAPRKLLIGLMVYALCMRVLPYALQSIWGVKITAGETIYPWNFSPFSATVLFGATYFASRRTAFLVPMLILLLGDLGIWAFTGQFDWAFYRGMEFVYLGFLVTATLGLFLRQKCTAMSVLTLAFVSEVAFFLITNFGSWWTMGFYPHTASGLMDCYVAGLPFFRNSLISCGFFSMLLFGFGRQFEHGTASVKASMQTSADIAG